MPGQVHFERKDGVATLTLDNPKARNAFDYEMTQELRRRWSEITRDPEIVCAIVTGAGEKAFCTRLGHHQHRLGREPQVLAERAQGTLRTARSPRSSAAAGSP